MSRSPTPPQHPTLTYYTPQRLGFYFACAQHFIYNNLVKNYMQWYKYNEIHLSPHIIWKRHTCTCIISHCHPFTGDLLGYFCFSLFSSSPWFILIASLSLQISMNAQRKEPVRTMNSVKILQALTNVKVSSGKALILDFCPLLLNSPTVVSRS